MKNEFEISKMFSFESAHSLPFLPEGHKCKNVHGHSYRFEVVCRGKLDERGFVIDYAEISKAVESIVKFLDHKNLNDILPFKTTAENICKYIFDEVYKKISVLYQIRFYETAKTQVTYPI